VEHLSELHRVFAAVDEEVAGHEAEDAVVDRGLRVEALDLVLNVAERAELVDDARHALELLSLEGKHRVLCVEFFQVLAGGQTIRGLRDGTCQTRCSSAGRTAVQWR